MKVNPGGQLAPDQIVGRDALIDEMWAILEGQSIYMNDLRRIGKTQIMVKMHEEARPGWLTIKRDLGGTHTAAEFATLAFKDSFQILGERKQFFRRMKDWLGEARGFKFAGVVELPNGTPAPWKEVLRQTFADIEEALEEQGHDQRMLFLWDEVPFMLDNIAKREGAAVAMEVLDMLRALEQDHNHIRFVLTGSIGIHHVLNDLKQEGYTGSPLNRMALIQPGPIVPLDGIALAAVLLDGSGVTCADQTACAKTVAERVGYVPFYIHKLISRLPKAQDTTPESITSVLDREILSDNSDWDFPHYQNRLKPYYKENEPLALGVLDAVAYSGELDFATLRKQLSGQRQFDDEQLRNLLKLLCMDHYLCRTEANTYRFYLDLIGRWWRLSRSL